MKTSNDDTVFKNERRENTLWAIDCM